MDVLAAAETLQTRGLLGASRNNRPASHRHERGLCMVMTENVVIDDVDEVAERDAHDRGYIVKLIGDDAWQMLVRKVVCGETVRLIADRFCLPKSTVFSRLASAELKLTNAGLWPIAGGGMIAPAAMANGPYPDAAEWKRKGDAGDDGGVGE